MSNFPKAIHWFNTISLKAPMTFSFIHRKEILKFIWGQGFWIAKTIMGQNKARSHIFPNFKIHYKPSVIKRVWHWCKDRHIDQWNRIKKSTINPHTYGQMIFNKGVKEKIVSSTNGVGETTKEWNWTLISYHTQK